MEKSNVWLLYHLSFFNVKVKQIFAKKGVDITMRNFFSLDTSYLSPANFSEHQLAQLPMMMFFAHPFSSQNRQSKHSLKGMEVAQ